MHQLLKKKKPFNRRERGAALLLTLIAISIASLAGATVVTLVSAHNTRANNDESSMKALYAADAAMNYETQRIYANLSNDQVGYTGSNVEAATYGFLGNQIPVTAKQSTNSLTGVTAPLGNSLALTGATDYARCYVQYADDPTGTRALDVTSTDPLYIYGTASVNGVVRTVRVTATSKALFSTWGVFTNGPLSVGGSLAATPAAGQTSSLVGSNTSISVATHTSSGCTQAACGSKCQTDSCCPVKSCPKACLPSIDQLANAAAGGHSGCGNCTGGICQFATCNDNQTCARCCDDVTPMQSMPSSGNCPSCGHCQMYLTGKPGGSNIYLTRLNCNNNNGSCGLKIWANTSKGPVNVWVNNQCSDCSSKDCVSGDVDICPFSSWDKVNHRPCTQMSDCNNLHIYYSNQCGSLTVNCNGTTKNVCGQIYAYNTFNGGTTQAGSVNLSGNTTVNGQIYSQSLTTSGNLTVNAPPTATPTSGGGLMFSASTAWQEVAPIYGNTPN